MPALSIARANSIIMSHYILMKSMEYELILKKEMKQKKSKKKVRLCCN